MAPKTQAAAPVKAPVEDEDSYDEEEMYGQGTKFAAVEEEDDGFEL